MRSGADRRAWRAWTACIGFGMIAALAFPQAYAQESLCDPCVDPPLNRQPAVPEAAPFPSPDGLNLGKSIANLRGLGATSGSRTLTLVDSRRQPAAEPVQGEGAAPVGDVPVDVAGAVPGENGAVPKGADGPVDEAR